MNACNKIHFTRKYVYCVKLSDSPKSSFAYMSHFTVVEHFLCTAENMKRWRNENCRESESSRKINTFTILFTATDSSCLSNVFLILNLFRHQRLIFSILNHLCLFTNKRIHISTFYNWFTHYKWKRF